MRRRTGLFLVEGPQAVREAVRFASVDQLYLTDDAVARYPEIVTDAGSRGLRLRLVSPEVATAMSPDAQGLIAVAQQSPVLVADLLATGPKLVALCYQMADPGNAGTVIRAADAMGAGGVIFTESSVEVYSGKVVRSSAGSLFHLPVVTGVPIGVIGELQSAGLQVLAADGGGEVDLDQLQGPEARLDLRAPTAWLLGNEAHGLPADVLELADASVRIPLHGAAESLNVAMAATICLYTSARMSGTESESRLDRTVVGRHPTPDPNTEMA